MKASWKLFGGLSVFYVLMTVIYWQVGGEEVGIAGMLLSACLAGMVGFYVWFTQKRIGVTLPEDNLTAEIADGAGELGFYSPHSWIASGAAPLSEPESSARPIAAISAVSSCSTCVGIGQGYRAAATALPNR
jgi:hypothetical protein